MALPVIVTPTVPQPTDSPGNAPAIFNALWTLFLDIFGMPANTPITGNLMTLGTNTDGRLATLPITRAPLPFLRLTGTEVGGIDMRMVESAGGYLLQINTGTEGAPTWTTIWEFVLGGLTQAGVFVHNNTAQRTYTLPDKNGVLATLADATGFPTGTTLLFQQVTPPTGWTRVVNAGITDSVIRLVSNGEVPGVGGSWSVSGFGADSHVLLQSEMPTHAHTILISNQTGVQGAGASAAIQPGGAIATELQGGGGGHTHTVSNDATWRPKYVDVIVAQKA